MASEYDDNSSLLFDFGTGEPNIVNLDEDYDDDSDGTLLGDEFEERFVNPTPDTVFVRALPSNTGAGFANDLQRLDAWSFDGKTYKPGKTVELLDGDFLRIIAIVPDHATQLVSFEGIKFRRNKNLGGLLEFKMNEVTMLLDFDESDPRDVYHQSIKAVPLSDILRIRKLVVTNQLFPTFSFRQADPNFRSQGKDYIMEYGQLVCRTRHVSISKNEGYIQVHQDYEADEGYAIDDGEQRRNFRGETIKGGACKEWLTGEESFDRNERARCGNIDPLHHHLPSDTDVHKPRYNFADAFCGAGGASRGAKAAGLRVDWGFDYDPAAIDSYRRNFYGTRCEAVAVHEFVIALTEDFRVDILHLSPPCQPFSPMHTRPGQNDKLNQATFLAVTELINKVKPRIVTLEETFGLTRQVDSLPWFTAMIQMFTKLAFSVRWKVFNLCDFGLPQPRKRLIIFASCPGEVLTEFPSATHCKAADLHRFPRMSRFTTVHDAIADIPEGFPLHNPDQMVTRNDAPYSGDLPLRYTICCGGGPICHPSGKRGFTHRELACLQGFPLEHQFGPSRARKQIGNAYPPVVAKVFFEAIIKALLEADGLTKSTNGELSSQQPSSSRQVPPLSQSVPSTQNEQLYLITEKFHKDWVPRCIQFMDHPPSDPKARDFEYKKLSEEVTAQVLFKLDEVTTEGYPEARARRKQLVTETRSWLTELDRAQKRGEEG